MYIISYLTVCINGQSAKMSKRVGNETGHNFHLFYDYPWEMSTSYQNIKFDISSNEIPYIVQL